MLHIRDLNSHYGLSHVIQGISLDVQKGEILGVFWNLHVRIGQNIFTDTLVQSEAVNPVASG